MVGAALGIVVVDGGNVRHYLASGAAVAQLRVRLVHSREQKQSKQTIGVGSNFPNQMHSVQ